MTIKHCGLLYEDFASDTCDDCCFMIKEENYCDVPSGFPSCSCFRDYPVSFRFVRELTDDEL